MSTPSDRAPGGWTADKERSNFWTLRLMRWIAVTAGRPVARLVLHPITLYFLLANGKARRASLNYLVRVLGRPTRWIDAYRHIHCFASTILDRVYFLQERFDQFEVSDVGGGSPHTGLGSGSGAAGGRCTSVRHSASGQRTVISPLGDAARTVSAALPGVGGSPEPTISTHSRKS